MARRHPIAVAIKQQAGEEARLTMSCACATLGGVAGKLRLNRIPQRLIDDGGVLTRMGLLLVDDLASIDPVLQHQIERAAGEWLAASQATRCARPELALDAAGVELVLQQPDRAEFGIAAKNEAHGFRLAVDDDQLAVLRLIPERRHAAHPHPFLLRGGDLVADALADDLALELREGQQNVEGQVVESECGAVAVGRTYLLPPLSSGGALPVRPAQPHSRVAVERAICFAGGADTEVIGPSAKRAVQHVDELCGLLPATRSVGQRMDSFDHALDALL